MLDSIERRFIRMQFGSRARIRIYKKLIRFLSNNMSLSQALDVMHLHASEEGRKPKNVTAIVLDQWRREIRNGKTFGRAIQGWVPEADRLVIEGGDGAGKLPTAIEKAILIGDSQKKIRQTLIEGLGYPLLLVAIAIGFLVMFGTEVIPAFEEILPRDKWTGAGAQMAYMSDFVRYYLAWTLGVLTTLTVLSIWSLPRWTGRWRVRFDRIPPWSLYRLVLGSGFLLTVSGMVKSGMAVPTILRTLQRDASPWYRERLARALDHVNNGFNLGDALHMTGFQFPDKESVQDLRAYAGLNKFDETLERMGVEWLEDSVTLIRTQTGILRNLSFLLLGGTFMWIATGIFSLQEQIQGAL